MKSILLLAAALAPAFAQISGPVAVTVREPESGRIVQPAAKAAVSRQELRKLETHFDDNLGNAGGTDHFDLRGYTRGIYLDGYGVVFTAEVDLIVSPMPNPFRQVIPPAEVAKVHQRKLDHVPILIKLMKDMMTSSAGALAELPANDQIVVSVRMQYHPWEDTKGLPTEIVMKADRKSALAGQIQMEEQ